MPIFWRRSQVRSSTPQTSLASSLPPEIVFAILQVLNQKHRYSEPCYSSSPFQAPPAIRAAPLVCRGWNSAATSVLYDSVRIPSLDALVRLLKTLKRSPALCVLPHSCSYDASSQPQNLPFLLKRPNEFDGIKLLFSLCPNMQHLSLGLHLFQSFKALMDHMDLVERVKFLHIDSPSASQWIYESNTFVNLVDLTLMSRIIACTNCHWPHISSLHSLRLFHCFVKWSEGDADPGFGRLRNLRELEIYDGMFGIGSFMKVLGAISTTLESLHVTGMTTLEVEYTKKYDLSILSEVNNLYLGPTQSLSLDSILKFPPALQHLTIRELKATDCRIVREMGKPDSMDSILKLLQFGKTWMFPLLETMIVWAEDNVWLARRQSLETGWRAEGVEFRLVWWCEATSEMPSSGQKGGSVSTFLQFFLN